MLYHEVAVALQAQPLAAHFDKTWGAHIGVKAGALLYPNCRPVSVHPVMQQAMSLAAFCCS